MASCFVVGSLCAPTANTAQSKKALNAFTSWVVSLSILDPSIAKQTVYNIEWLLLGEIDVGFYCPACRFYGVN
jgi:hypothetical protein